MTTQDIKQLKTQGLGNDAVYQLAAGNLNLFGVAFYGHKGTPSQKKALQRVWQLILNTK